MMKSTKIAASAMRRRGQALVPVILVVLILTTLAIAFTASSNRELKATTNFNAQTVQFNAARGAVDMVMSALGQVSLNGFTYGTFPPGPDTDANGWMPIGGAWVKVDVIDTAGLLDINQVTAAQLELMPVFSQNTPVADAVIDWRTPETTATSDGAKSDYYQGLNPPYNCKDAPFDTVDELLLVKGITPSLLYGTPEGTVISAADAPADVQNAASSSYLGGSGAAGGSSGNASGGATSRQATGAAGGGAAGATGGGATAATAGATAGDTDWDDIYSQSTMPLAEMFTTMSMERNIAADGTPRVNINTATVTDLTGIGISTNLANALIRYRTPVSGATGGGGGGAGGRPGGGGAGGRPGGGAGGGPGGGQGGAPGGGGQGGVNARPGGGGGGGARPGSRQTAGAMPGAGGAGTGATAGTGTRPGTGTATTGTSGTTFKTIADMLTIPGFSQTVMQQIADYVSVDSNQFHPNLVNINTASQEVLALVPGMDHATLNAIIQYRQSGQAFQSMGDLFALQGVTRQEFQNVMASLCAKSSVYRVRVKVRTPGQQGVYAVTAYVEMTDNGPQLLQWRETPSVPGWAYWVPSPTLPAPTTTSTISGTTSGSVGQ